MLPDGKTRASILARSRNELRCLVQFMDTDMHDILKVQRQVESQVLEEIAFEYLWLLFKPGDLVFSVTSTNDDDLCQAYRVLHVTGGRHIIDPRSNQNSEAMMERYQNWDLDGEVETCNKARNSTLMTPLIIDCFSIDCSVYRFGPRSKRIVISFGM